MHLIALSYISQRLVSRRGSPTCSASQSKYSTWLQPKKNESTLSAQAHPITRAGNCLARQRALCFAHPFRPQRVRVALRRPGLLHAAVVLEHGSQHVALARQCGASGQDGGHPLGLQLERLEDDALEQTTTREFCIIATSAYYLSYAGTIRSESLYLGWYPDEGEARRVLWREDVLVQWPDAVVVDGEPVQVEEGEMAAIPEGMAISCVEFQQSEPSFGSGKSLLSPSAQPCAVKNSVCSDR
jgi:hypothetical protein